MPDELRGILRTLAKGEGRWPLYLYGQPGTGKTCSSLALVDRVLPIRLYATVETLVQWMLGKTWQWRELENARLLVIDELGQRTEATDIEYAAVKAAADAREHQPAIYISNHPPERMRDFYDSRVFSRICSGGWYELTGPDHRMD